MPPDILSESTFGLRKCVVNVSVEKGFSVMCESDHQVETYSFLCHGVFIFALKLLKGIVFLKNLISLKIF